MVCVCVCVVCAYVCACTVCVSVFACVCACMCVHCTLGMSAMLLLSPHIVQVDDLKEKLKAQEVELKQKNEDADALIKRVAIEQEKVGKEKAFADEEEKKVAKINEEVSKKQKDCETDLAKAEPALKVCSQMQWHHFGMPWKPSGCCGASHSPVVCTLGVMSA